MSFLFGFFGTREQHTKLQSAVQTKRTQGHFLQLSAVLQFAHERTRARNSNSGTQSALCIQTIDDDDDDDDGSPRFVVGRVCVGGSRRRCGVVAFCVCLCMCVYGFVLLGLASASVSGEQRFGGAQKSTSDLILGDATTATRCDAMDNNENARLLLLLLRVKNLDVVSKETTTQQQQF